MKFKNLVMKKLERFKVRTDRILPNSELIQFRGGDGWLCQCAVYFEGQYDGLHTFPCGAYGSSSECDDACATFWEQNDHPDTTCICNWGY
jgi:hypothetical protein